MYRSVFMLLVALSWLALTTGTSVLQLDMYMRAPASQSTSDLRDQNSEMYKEMKQKIEDFFTYKGGAVDDLIFNINENCVWAYVTLQDVDKYEFLGAVNKITQNHGFEFRGELWVVSFNDCQNIEALTQFHVSMYLQNDKRTSLDDLVNRTSEMFNTMRNKIIELFSPLKGVLSDVIFAKSDNCIQAYIVWNTVGGGQALLELVEKLAGSGFEYHDDIWGVSFTECSDIIIPPKKEEHEEGLDHIEKVIIGVVCGAVGLLIIALLVYCICCRQKKDKYESTNKRSRLTEAEDSATFDKQESNVFYNNSYDSGDMIKVRL